MIIALQLTNSPTPRAVWRQSILAVATDYVGARCESYPYLAEHAFQGRCALRPWTPYPYGRSNALLVAHLKITCPSGSNQCVNIGLECLSGTLEGVIRSENPIAKIKPMGLPSHGMSSDAVPVSLKIFTTRRGVSTSSTMQQNGQTPTDGLCPH